MKVDDYQIKIHDGPARYGMVGGAETPLLLKHEEMEIAEYETLPYSIPRELAEWGVAETLRMASGSDAEYAFIHGSMYRDLRVKCALELEDLGFRRLIVANMDELLQRPRDLVETVTSLREALKPDTLLCSTFSHPAFIPLLAYMGMDIFSDALAEFYGRLNVFLTETHTYPLNEYRLYEMGAEELVEENRRTLNLVIREVRERIKKGTLRNLVEERAASSPVNMSALRILDHEKQDFLQKYTQLY
ncbi:Archaeosine synthase [Methanothermobacter wolfeii]|uniref:archaeosine tRNA-ribosyltransferase n=1 Tax=Methanothermobacter TaxID=145260 RepID=UPI00092DCCD2|nr:archaeosine tRNA-ribosyltransferase [Methanothermobacter sp. THM-1]QHN05950.1 archaeosine tRNA-ribosyltransferase [Methanothermobacter sp. THM-1]SCM56246.1 Archaeosine synthase [Methanothermobacter wolfeii]